MPYLTQEELDGGILDKYKTNAADTQKQHTLQWNNNPNYRKLFQDQDAANPNKVTPMEEERTLGGTLKDIGVSLGKGGVGAVEGVVGLADLVTPGNLGGGLENVGLDLGGAQEYLSDQYSGAQQQAFKNVEDVKGFLPTLGSMIANPSTIGHSLVESAPSMLVGGAIGKGLGMAAKIPGLVGGAIGEGAMTAGQTQENVRRQSGGDTTLGQQAMAIGAGIGTGAFGYGGAKFGKFLAKKLGVKITDLDTLAAGGKIESAGNIGKRLLAGGISEGVFEELPQSMQEQVWMNAATGQPLDTDVGKSGAAGLLAGAAMGGGANIFTNQNNADTSKKDAPGVKVDPNKQAAIINAKEQLFAKEVEFDQAVEAGDTEKLSQLQDEIKQYEDFISIEAQRVEAETALPNNIILKQKELARKKVSLRDAKPEDKKQLRKDIVSLNTEVTEQVGGFKQAIKNNPEKMFDLFMESPDVFEQLSDDMKQIVTESHQEYLDNIPDTDPYWDRQTELIRKQQERRDAPKTTDRLLRENQQERIKQQDIKDQNQLQKQAADAEMLRQARGRQRIIDETYMPAEEEIERIRQYREEEQAQFDSGKSILDNDIVNKEGKVFPNPGAAKASIVAHKNNFAYDVVPVANGYVGRMVPERLDPRHPEYGRSLTEDEYGLTSVSGPAYAKEQERLLRYQQLTGGSLQPHIQTLSSDPVVNNRRRNQGLISSQEVMPVVEDPNLVESELRRSQVEQQVGESKMDVAASEVETPQIVEEPQSQDVQPENTLNLLDELKRINAKKAKSQVSPKEQQLSAQLDKIQSDMTDAIYAEKTATNAAERGMAIERQSRLTNEKQRLTRQLEDIAMPKLQTDAAAKVSQGKQTTDELSLEYIKNAYPDQKVVSTPTGIQVTLNNGSQITVDFTPGATSSEMNLAIETKQMSEGGIIKGATTGTNIRLFEGFADKGTFWHENEHVIEALGLRTERENNELVKEFDTLRNQGALTFSLSTHEDPGLALKEDLANMFSQVMLSREAYRGKILGAMRQRIIDFFHNMFNFGRSTIRTMARDVETGKIYERQINGQLVQTTIPQNEVAANKWYSTLENAVVGFQQKVAMSDQWKGMIKKYPGIKQEELDWIGLDDWLSEQKGKVRKEDLLQFIQDNNVQLEEVVKKNKELFLEEPVEEDATEYDHMVLPGGKNYQERLITIPITKGKIDSSIEEQLSKDLVSAGFSADLDNTAPGYLRKQGYGELADRLIERNFALNGANYEYLKDLYQSAHWDEPNTVAHIRFDERTDAAGNKVLFLNEIQSDWHQEGHREGYQTKPTWTAYNEIKAFADQQGINIRTEAGEYLPIKEQVMLRRAAKNTIGIEVVDQMLARVDDEIINNKTTSIIPDAPFKKSWPLLTLKRMVRYAAENGFDKIAWPSTPEQVAKIEGWGKIKEEKTDQGTSYFIQDNKNVSSIVNRYLVDMPRMLNKEFNRGKWGKAKVQQDTIGVQATSVLSLPITDRMKSKALREGMPMFEVAGNTESLEFKAWFGKSVAKTKDGMPAKFYHGTPNDFTVFEDRAGESTTHTTSGLGHFFSMDSDYASTYAKDGGKVLETYLKMEKPYKMPLEQAQSIPTVEAARRVKQQLRNKGYDSVIIPIPGAQPYIAIFSPEQIKAVNNEGTWDSNNPDIRFQTSEQTISNEEYLRIHKQTRNLWNRVKKQSRSQKSKAANFAEKYFAPISTRLFNINPDIGSKVRKLDFDTTHVIANQIKIAEPTMRSKEDMSPEDRTAWDWARKERDLGKIEYITEKYNITDEYSKVKDLLNQVHADAKAVGMDVGYIEDYWPRVLKDVEGFLQATKKISTQDVFSKALKAEAAKQGIRVEELDPLVRADIISNMILGRGVGISGPGNTQARVFNRIPEEFAEFYMDSDGALMQYIYSMNKKIEARKFFGKVPEKIAAFKKQRRSANTQLIKLQELAALAASEGRPNDYVEQIKAYQQDIKLADQEINTYAKQTNFTDNIGSYVDELLANGKIDSGDEQALLDILDARFHEHGTRGNVSAAKNLALIDTMGNPFSALTQIGDLAWAYYVGGLTPTGIARTTKNIMKAAVGKSGIKKEDLGFERIAQEFADNGSLSNAVTRVFRMVGLEKMDSIGKEALINNSFENYKNKANQDPTKLKKEIRHIFGNQTDQVVTDLIGNNPTENVKLLLYNRVLDFQPVALSEMPEKYLNAGNGRIFWMLKTFTLKQMDVFRREVFQNFKKGDAEGIKQGMVNMAQLTFLLTIANAGADEIKDYLKGDEVSFKDNVIENMLSLGGASRFMQLQVNQEGLGSAMLQKILPPMKFIDSMSQDIIGDTSKGYRTLDSVPVAGKLLYWHMGRGSEFTSTEKEKEFKKEVKEANKFKKQLDAADNKREFIYANLEDFRKVKQIQNMQSTLNKNKALINRLKEMKQTTNVRKRISQLEQRRELYLQKFLKN